MKSTSGYCFSIGSRVVSWCSKKQYVVAKCTADAEYVANQAIWLRKVLSDLKLAPAGPTQILMDNKAAIAIVKNPVLHDKTKQFKIKLHVIRHYEEKKLIQVVYCSTDEQVVDIFTKALPAARFEELREKLGIRSLEFKEE